MYIDGWKYDTYHAYRYPLKMGKWRVYWLRRYGMQTTQGGNRNRKSIKKRR